MRNPYVNLLKMVWTQGREFRGTIVLYYSAFIVAQAFLSLTPYVAGRLIDVLQQFTPERFQEVILWLGAQMGVLLVFWIFHGPARIKERQVALKIQQRLRNHLYAELNRLPLKWHQQHHSGHTISRIQRAALALYRFAGDQFIYIETIVKFVIAVGFLFWISAPVGLFSFLSCALVMTAVLAFDRILIPMYHAENEIDNHVGAVLFDYVSNMTSILTLRLSESTRAHFVHSMMKVWPIFNKEVVWNEIKWGSVGLLMSACQIAILMFYILSTLHQTGTLWIGIVVMIFRYQWDLTEVFYTFSFQYSELVRMDADVQGLKPLLDDMVQLKPPVLVTASIENWQKIHLKNLVFSHRDQPERVEQTIDDLELTVARGEKIALLGSSGGGKSTLLNLLRGLYPADAVVLDVDGTTFSSLAPLQDITTLIPQDPELFENTVRFNITLDLPATQEEIDSAIHLSGFAPVLATLPLGLDTPITEKGCNLSIGQKQRLALARGIFASRTSSLILMDEPTSSVDLQTEKQILSGMIAAFPDASMMVSLHRLHLLPEFDRVILLQDGRVIAHGPTARLLSESGPVRQLWEMYQNNKGQM